MTYPRFSDTEFQRRTNLGRLVDAVTFSIITVHRFPEFGTGVLEVTAANGRQGYQPSKRIIKFLCQFPLTAAMNPCLCGFYGDTQKPCTCAHVLVTKYQKRISGPLLDRIGIHIEVPRVD